MAKSKPKPAGISPALRKAIDSAAKKAAEKAVEDVLVRIGINTETVGDQIESQADAKFVRRLRLTSESAPAQYGLAAFGALLSVVGALFTLGVQWLISGAPKP